MFDEGSFGAGLLIGIILSAFMVWAFVEMESLTCERERFPNPYTATQEGE